MLLKKGLNISFLEIMLSLVVWGFLLGPVGGILAIPLTLALRRVIEKPYTEAEAALAQGVG
jgi:AI-2 transport protein TqsA